MLPNQYPPPADGADPSADPPAYLADLLARYFRPGMVDSLIRTWVPIAVGAALSWAAVHWQAFWQALGLPDKPSETTLIIATGAAIALYYWAARAIERRFPTLGRWMLALNLTKSRPAYAEPPAADQVEAAAARPTGRH